jgi:hypothetical protein
MVLRHLLGKNLINRILENLDLLWKRITKKRRFPIAHPAQIMTENPFGSSAS